jgi:hypothetical protein
LLYLVGIFVALCLVLSAISAISNQGLPGRDTSDQLSELDKARLLEAIHLKSALGDRLWKGWGEADVPFIIWNDSFEFLFEYPGEPPAGWTPVPNDTFQGQAYYRQKADDPQNFAVPVGDIWAVSMATKSATDVFLISSFREMFPPPIKQIFPYRILIQPSETQVGGVLHESFHVYQMLTSPTRLDTAEKAHRLGDEYESAAEKFSAEWKQESVLLADALEAKTPEEKFALVQQFLETRDSRRSTYALDPVLVDYERQLEWEEGTAKYIEVAILKTAFEAVAYQPTPEMASDPDFKAYQVFPQRWSQELIQLRYQTTSGESQFYMTGMAQAFLLDDLLPGWQEKYWQEGVFLEDLLKEAVR